MDNGQLFCELEDADGYWIPANIIPESGMKYMNANGKLIVEY